MANKSVKDYYAILGVPPTASVDEIRLAYRRQARVFHPDLSAEPDAEERFKEVNEAYEILANSDKRKAYDYFTSGAGDDPSASQVPPEPPSPWPAGPSAPPPGGPMGTPHPVADAGVSAASKPRRLIYPPTWAILLIVLGACIIVAVAIGAILSLQSNRPTGGAQSVDVTKLVTFVSPPTIPDDLTVIQEDNTPVNTVAPVQLSVGGTTYPVVAVVPEQGRWPMPAEQMEQGLWMFGTLINYVIGLPYSESAESLLANLDSGDRITLTLENGTQLAFGSPQVQRVDAGDTSALSQTRPGLTLMTVGGEGVSRLVVKARYLPEDTRPSTEQGADGLTVRILDAGIIENATPDQAGSWYFLVEYVVTNTITSSIDPTFFDMVLEDGSGQRYIRSDEATARGQYGLLSLLIPPAGSARGSAGYVIPQTARAPLVWVFRADVTSTDQARLVVNFEPPRPRPAQPDVELYEAFLDEIRDVIVISGTVYNDGESTLQVAEGDVSLTAGSGRATLMASTPLLPWSVPGDDYQDFELQFGVPAGAESVLLTVLGFAFEIEGLAP